MGSIAKLSKSGIRALLDLRCAISLPSGDLVEPSRAGVRFEHPKGGVPVSAGLQVINRGGEKSPTDADASCLLVEINGSEFCGERAGVLVATRARDSKPEQFHVVLRKPMAILVQA